MRARNQIKAGTLMALESSGARCEQAARHLIIHGRPIPYAEIVARIEAVDQDAVRRVARRLLKGKLTLAALGPIDELEAARQDRRPVGGLGSSRFARAPALAALVARRHADGGALV